MKFYDKRTHTAAEAALSGGEIGREEALRLAEEAPLEDLLYWANLIRKTFKGESVSLCAIANAKSGLCGEDCAFCSQSGRWATQGPVHGMRAPEEIAESARRAEESGADEFGIVVSGRGPDEKDFDGILSAVRAVRAACGLEVHASAGKLSGDQIGALKEAGVARVNHNLETSERFFPSICTTHTWRERARSIEEALSAGMKVCAGGIFGMGEGWGDRVDMTLALRELGVDAVPVNFLHPVPGTPLGDRPRMPALEALRIIALLRFLMPRAEIRTCGGREAVLGQLQSVMFHAGASATLLGDYLTTRGRPPREDIDLIESLGLKRRPPPRPRASAGEGPPGGRP